MASPNQPSSRDLVNPRRAAAGKANRARRGPLTEEGREALRQAALANRPWEASTGPRTPEGKRQVARNGKVKQKALLSVRELRVSLAGERSILDGMLRSRMLVADLLAGEVG